MVRATYFVILAIYLAVAGTAIQNAFLSSDFDSALTGTARVMGAYSGPIDRKLEARSAFEQWSSLAKDQPGAPETQYQLGRSALLLALLSAPEDQPPSMCRAYEAFSRAVTLSPHRALYHIGLADIEAAIPHPARYCGTSTTSPFPDTTDPKHRLAWGTLLAPWGSVELYYSALVYLSLGDRTRALELLRVNDEYNPTFSRAQKEFLYRLVRSEAELKIALPHRFPETINWINYFHTSRFADYQRWSDAFSVALNGAVGELEERWKLGQINARQYGEYLAQVSRLPLLQHYDEIRRRVDYQHAIAAASEKLNSLAKFYTERSQLRKIPTLKAHVKNDRIPSRTELSSWQRGDSTRRAYLRTTAESIGLYIPRGSDPALIIIQSSTTIGPRLTNSLEVLVGSDNLNFAPLAPTQIERIASPNGELIALRFKELHFPLLKIRLKGEALGAPLENSLSEIVEVYGSTL